MSSKNKASIDIEKVDVIPMGLSELPTGSKSRIYADAEGRVYVSIDGSHKRMYRYRSDQIFDEIARIDKMYSD